MIEDNIALIASPDGIGTAPVDGGIGQCSFVAQPEAQETNYHVVGLNNHRKIFEANAITRCTLSGNGQIAIFNPKFRFQRDCTRNFKHNNSRTGLIYSPSQSAGSTVVSQFCDIEHRASPSAGGVHSIAFSSRKSRNLCTDCGKTGCADNSYKYENIFFQNHFLLKSIPEICLKAIFRNGYINFFNNSQLFYQHFNHFVSFSRICLHNP